MILGLVSNCWHVQLAQGVPLEALLAKAVDFGCRAVELRQGALGEYETGTEPLPDAERLAVLPERFPGLQFNVAVQMPFLGLDVTLEHPVFGAGWSAAQAVAGDSEPHLRLVDLTTTGHRLAGITWESAGRSLANLARAVLEEGGHLSVEHARQPWTLFQEALHYARRQLGDDADRLRLCYDPCNLLLAGETIDPADVTAALRIDEMAMVHVKQSRDGTVLPIVCDGDVDWAAQITALQEKEYDGPVLFEVASHADVWTHLEDSAAYLERLGLERS